MSIGSLNYSKGISGCRLKKGLWREQMPEDFLAQKWVAGPDGEYKRDPTYVGENAWAESDDEGESVEKIAEEGGLTEEEKAELDEIINMTRAHRGLPPRGTKVMPPAESFDNEANGGESTGQSNESICNVMIGVGVKWSNWVV